MPSVVYFHCVYNAVARCIMYVSIVVSICPSKCALLCEIKIIGFHIIPRYKINTQFVHCFCQLVHSKMPIHHHLLTFVLFPYVEYKKWSGMRLYYMQMNCVSNARENCISYACKNSISVCSSPKASVFTFVLKRVVSTFCLAWYKSGLGLIRLN